MKTAMVQGQSRLTNPHHVFMLLTLYRWLSLIPPLVTFFISGFSRATILAFLLAVSANILISLFPRQINRQLRARPYLLFLDLALVAGLVFLTDGWHSPYYLYALSPLLVAAFYFQLRGALLAALVLSFMYLPAVVAAARLAGGGPEWLAVVTAVVGFFLIGGAFGYASSMVRRLRQARDELTVAHRDLEVIHDLTVSLQSAADVEEVQERVLEAVTFNLGFERAVVGLVDQDREIITGWVGRALNGQMISENSQSYLKQVPLSREGGPVAGALRFHETRQIMNCSDSSDKWISRFFGITHCLIFPMVLREHPVGVLLVDAAGYEDDASRMQSLNSIASQAAVAIGTTMMCIDRAQRLAVQEERLRIAQDIHDVVSQSLFGIVYTLDGSLKLLPEQPEEVIPELERALRVAEETHNEVRQSILNIWPSQMTAVRFTDGLRKYTTDVCQAGDLQLLFQMNGDFERLSPQARRCLYRIAQESLTNVAHHAHATEVAIRLDVQDEQAKMTIEDDGRGFDPDMVLVRDYDREHFGLRGIQERVRILGGTCEIHSQNGSGSSIVVDIPV